MVRKRTVVPDFFAEALKTAEAKAGKDGCYIAARHEDNIRVLPIPNLSLQWLVNSNGWPLQRMTQSGGAFGSNKSSFIFQLISWYLQAGGYCYHIDTENKTSASLMRSIIPKEYFDPDSPESARFIFAKAGTVNQWQQLVTDQFALIKKYYENTKVPFPVLVSVDSMTGSSSDTMAETIADSGEAMGRGYTDIPILISNYLRNVPNMLLGWPTTLHVSHHEKQKIGGVGISRAGGNAPDFYATLDLQFKKGGVSAYNKAFVTDIERADFSGRNITISIRKSSMGPDNRAIVVPFLWSFVEDPETKKLEQVSWWDWNSATADVLEQNNRELKASFKIETDRKHGVGSVYWCDQMGIKKEDAMQAAAFGTHVETTPEIRAEVSRLLHIETHKVFETEDE